MNRAGSSPSSAATRKQSATTDVNSLTTERIRQLHSVDVIASRLRSLSWPYRLNHRKALWRGGRNFDVDADQRLADRVIAVHPTCYEFARSRFSSKWRQAVTA